MLKSRVTRVSRKQTPLGRTSTYLVEQDPSLELRRWCIEQAIKWPQDFGRAYSSMSAQYPHPPVAMQEANIIGRAEAILKWVTGTK